MKELLQIQSHEESGLSTLVEGNGWNVLLLNHLPRLSHGAVTQLHKHTQTKETFVLLSGTVLLVWADGEDAPARISGVMMEPGKVYTAECGVWHATVMSEDAKILLVENTNTTAENTFRAELTADQAKQIEKMGEGHF